MIFHYTCLKFSQIYHKLTALAASVYMLHSNDTYRSKSHHETNQKTSSKAGDHRLINDRTFSCGVKLRDVGGRMQISALQAKSCTIRLN